jgi:hypothetical protein
MFSPTLVGRCKERFSILVVVALAILLNVSFLSAGERYAFLVGVREYDKTQLNPLSFTENDVVRLAGVLRAAGYRKEDIVLMTQTLGATNTRFLPIADKIRRELALLISQVRKDDSILVALSGHGVQFAGEDDLFFCPADANLKERTTLLSLGQMYKDLDKCAAGVKLLFVDACRNDPVSTISKSRRIVELQTLDKVQPRDPPGGISAFFSCSRGEQSFEHPALKQGIFFHFVTRALAGAADFNKDRQVSLPELEQFAVGEVQRYARVELGVNQTPERRGQARGLVTLTSVVRPTASPAPAVVLLDNALRLLTASGEELWARSGIRNDQAIGGMHGVAIDRKRGRIYIRESLAHRFVAYNMQGEELWQVEQRYAAAMTLDERTGNLWTSGGGRLDVGEIVVLDPQGNKIATHPFPAVDLVYDPHTDAFWLVGAEILKLNRKGDVWFRQKAGFACVSVSVNPTNGGVWIVERAHTEVPQSKNLLWLLDADGSTRRRLDFGSELAFLVECHPKTGDAWVGVLHGTMRRVSPAGEFLESLGINASNISASRTTDEIWVRTPQAVLRLDATGKTLARSDLRGQAPQTWLMAF